jgi:hypothetical protein
VRARISSQADVGGCGQDSLDIEAWSLRQRRDDLERLKPIAYAGAPCQIVGDGAKLVGRLGQRRLRAREVADSTAYISRIDAPSSFRTVPRMPR